MQFYQVPVPGASQSGLQAPVYQYVHGVSSQGHLQGIGQTFGMFNANFLSAAQYGGGSGRPQGSSWYYEPLHAVNVYPETLTLNGWHQRHETLDIRPQYPVNSLVQVPHSKLSCNIQPIGVTGLIQYPGLAQRQYLPATELHNTRGQMFYQPPVYIQQQKQLPTMDQIPPGHSYPNNFSWTHHAIHAQDKIKPPNARKSLPSGFNNQDASQGSEIAITNMSSKVTGVEYRAGLNSHMDSGSKTSQQFTKNSVEKKRKESSICGTPASNTIQQNVAPDDTRRFFRWENEQEDPSYNNYSDGSMPDIVSYKDHTTLYCQQLESLSDSNTLFYPGNICTDQDTMVPAISPGVSSNAKNKNVPQGQKRSAKDLLGSLAKDLLSSNYEDPEVSLLISSMNNFYKITSYGDIESKINTSRSVPLSSSQNLAKWYSIFKKRRLCRLKAKTAKHQQSDNPKKQKWTHVNKVIL